MKRVLAGLSSAILLTNCALVVEPSYRRAVVAPSTADASVIDALPNEDEPNTREFDADAQSAMDVRVDVDATDAHAFVDSTDGRADVSSRDTGSLDVPVADSSASCDAGGRSAARRSSSAMSSCGTGSSFHQL